MRVAMRRRRQEWRRDRLTGDATLDTIATVDWTAKRYSVSGFHDFLEPLVLVVGAGPESGDIIAIAELMNLITYAATGARAWRGEVVLYAGCRLYPSPSPRDSCASRMPSSA